MQPIWKIRNRARLRPGLRLSSESSERRHPVREQTKASRAEALSLFLSLLYTHALCRMVENFNKMVENSRSDGEQTDHRTEERQRWAGSGLVPGRGAESVVRRRTLYFQPCNVVQARASFTTLILTFVKKKNRSQWKSSACSECWPITTVSSSAGSQRHPIKQSTASVEARVFQYASEDEARMRASVFWRVTGGGVTRARASSPKPVQTGHGRVWWVLMVLCSCFTALKRDGAVKSFVTQCSLKRSKFVSVMLLFAHSDFITIPRLLWRQVFRYTTWKKKET